MLLAAATSTVVSIGISLAALALGFFNFWWINRRKGTIHVGEARSYALYVPQSGNVNLQLPLVFANDGPRTRVIRNLRLRVPDLCGDRLMVFIATHDRLPSSSETGRTYATAFVVPPNSAQLVHCEFQGPPSHTPWNPAPFGVELLMQFDEQDRPWSAAIRERMGMRGTR